MLNFPSALGILLVLDKSQPKERSQGNEYHIT